MLTAKYHEVTRVKRSGSVKRILKRQGLKAIRAWLDAKPERLEELRRSIDSRDTKTLVDLLGRVPTTEYVRELLQRAGDQEWYCEVASLLDVPKVSEGYRSIRVGEFWYRAIDVSPTLLRSSQPKLHQLEALRLKIDGVVNLRDESNQSEELCRDLDLEYFPIPVIDHEVPSHEQMEQFLHLTDRFKLLVHCFAGRGRTGLFVACYRVGRQGLDAAQALALTEKEVPGMRANQVEWVRNFTT
jgi:hypothetical protein